MQTFLPYRSFTRSAQVLDRPRLGKQRVETLQIMKALVTGEGWINHPVTKMWRGYEYTLLSYQAAVCREWTDRGYRDTCLLKTEQLFAQLPQVDRMPSVPPWLNLKKFHIPHRANLIRKDPERYQPLWPDVKPQEGYWYPPEGYTRP